MSKEKQIEEMVKKLGGVWIVDWDGNPHNLSENLWDDDLENIAIELYNAGYRKQEWISVDERLPMYGEIVLVSAINKITGKHEWFYLASYDRERKWWNGALIGKVTHWMPLPEAPKGGAE